MMNNIMELKYAFPELYQGIRFRLLHNEKLRDYINSMDLPSLWLIAENCDNGDELLIGILNHKKRNTITVFNPRTGEFIEMTSVLSMGVAFDEN